MVNANEYQRIRSEILSSLDFHHPFATAVRDSMISIVMTDPRLPDNPIVYVNEAFVKLTGYSRDETLGRNCRFLQGPDTCLARVADVRSAISNNSRIETCLQNYRKDGSKFWNHLLVSPVFDKKGQLTYFFSSQFDATHEYYCSNKFEPEVYQNTQALNALLSSTSNVRFRVNADWTTLRLLKAGATLATPQPRHQYWLKHYISNSYQAKNKQEIARALSTKSDFLTEYPFYRTDGTMGWANSKAVPILNSSGEIVEWLGMATDTTIGKRAETEMRELNMRLEYRVIEAMIEIGKIDSQLRQSQKLEALGQLTGEVAHDFNNLLTIICSSVDLLKGKKVSDDRRLIYIDTIAETVERAKKLTGQLLTFARRQTSEPTKFSMREGVIALSRMLATLIGDRVKISTDLTNEANFVLADRNQFDTAIVNMAVNARDAMDNAGKLHISVRNVNIMPASRSVCMKTGPYVAVSMRDTGKGIPADKIEQIFEPFFTTKGAGKGTGLGLSQVHGFAIQFGGDVQVESKLGEGSIFTLYLPRVQFSETAPAHTTHGTSLENAPLSVLIVEDNIELASSTFLLLTDMGYKPIKAHCASEALSLIHDHLDSIDIVFSDIEMPGMDGFELAKKIRMNYPDLPVVLTSGSSKVLTASEGYEYYILPKPYSMMELSTVLRNSVACRQV